MLQSDKVALHYEVLADTAHKIEKVSKELSDLYKDDWFANSRVELRKKCLVKYLNELKTLTNKIQLEGYNC